MGAIYNSREREQMDAPKCHPDTRKAVIKRLIDWINGELDSEVLILWLYGAAGAGKSAIAHTLAEICENCGWLLASFFFWKTAGKCNNADHFVATIAHQIALAIPASRALIGAVVDYNPFIFQQSVNVQLTKLIVEPLEQLYSAGLLFDLSPLTIIIDGLDECQGSDIQSGLIKSLATAFIHSPLRIRILIASRPEVYLRSAFNSPSVQPHLARLALSDEYSAEKDISQFLKDSFEKIRREHPLARYIPPSWPSVDVLRELTKKSSGQFIFASTTIKYTGGDPYELPTHRLDVLRRLEPPRGEEDLPYAELNSLYNHVLSSVRVVEKVKEVLGVLIVVNPELHQYPIDSADKMDWFLFRKRGETSACLSQLISLIECDSDDSISILHASLSDFLLDITRSRRFYLCRESVLGDCIALGLRHMRQEVISEQGLLFPLLRFFFQLQHVILAEYNHCAFITIESLGADPSFTPALRHELDKITFQTLYDHFETNKFTSRFWEVSLALVDMLHNKVRRDELRYIRKQFLTIPRTSQTIISKLMLTFWTSASKLSKRLNPTKT